MTLNYAIIWKDEQSRQPFVSIDEIQTPLDNQITEVDIFFEGAGQLGKILESLDLLELWSSKRVLILPSNRISDFNNFFIKYNIRNKKAFFKLIAIINNEIFEREFINSEDKSLISQLFHYASHEKPLIQALQEYEKNYISKDSDQSNDLKDAIKSISFKFSTNTKTFKIQNHVVLTTIMNCLLLHYRFSDSVNFDLVGPFKKKIVKSLFIYFNSPNDDFYSQIDNDIYRIIEEIFSLADYSYNMPAIKKLLQRMQEDNEIL